METLLAIVGFAILFALFAAYHLGEGTRPCSGRSAAGDERCRACPLREGRAGTAGPCPGSSDPGAIER